MSTGNAPGDDTGLEAFLARQSPLSSDYDNLELAEPSAELDARILAAAKVAARPAAKPVVKPVAAGAAVPAATKPLPPKPARVRAPEPVADEQEDDAPPPARRPRWLVPAVIVAGVLAVAGIGFTVLDVSPSVTEETGGLGSLFAKRARERSKADKAAAEAAAAAEVEVMEMEALPPPPPLFFEVDGPQVEDLNASIALIRRELVLVNQREAAVEAQSPAATEAPAGSAGVIQPRNRRLAKILELYDAGNPYLAEDALGIFLRDFADDPISQRILGVKK